MKDSIFSSISDSQITPIFFIKNELSALPWAFANRRNPLRVLLNEF
ncbi:MAG: hypothetical protein SO116_08435 [Treponema sp.]|nr:hypothetical protein [Spirochaetia bacterium]MDD7013767.1 hypothetical protein [Spirochaetales bacterium]MDY4902877.1 hypothetical protein [Treponema sp.]